MGAIDEYKSVKNRDLLLHASVKMIKDKYNITINDPMLIKIINNIISIISNDAILINTSVKLSELNNLTLTKIKEFIGKQMKEVEAKENTEENISTLEKQKISEDDELLNKVQELEEKRRMANSLLLDAETDQPVAQGTTEPPEDNFNIASIKEQIYKTVIEKTMTKKPVQKKTFIIGSNSRDWVNQPQRHILQFNIGIDLQQNVVEPVKILFPKHVKHLTPYVNMVITDALKVQKYTYILHKNNGDWDEWILINNTDQPILFTHNDWKITFYDFLNKDLKLGNDDIKICEVSKYNEDEGFSLKIVLEKKHYAYFEYNLQSIKQNDDLVLNTFTNQYVNVRVLENNIEVIVIANDGSLRQEDFINSKLLNIRAQYFMVFSYYSKD